MFKHSRKAQETVSLERLRFLKKRRIYISFVNVARIFILIALFVLWEIAGRLNWIDPFIMSMPSRIVNTIVNLSMEGNLFYHIGISCLETVIGFVAGTVIGSVIAMLLWWSKFLSKVLEPYLVIPALLSRAVLKASPRQIPISSTV